MSLDRRRQMIEPGHPQLSIVRQCELVSINRSGFYHRPAAETPLNLELMQLIDAQFLEMPWYGARQMARPLRREGYTVGRKRIRRLMAKMGLTPIYQRPQTTVPNPEHRIYPYLLRDRVIDQPDQVWWMDNVLIERLWRSLKDECVYLHAFETGSEPRAGLTKWIDYYSAGRPQSALAGPPPRCGLWAE